jgi:glycosyltransferase involved in cell wall biosynthesis
MAAGCLVVGSRTAPVEEVIRHGGNGLLVDFSSPQEIADRVVEALEDRRAHDSIRLNARQTIIHQYDLRTLCLPAHLRLVHTVAQQARQSTSPADSGQASGATAPRMLGT